MSLLDILLITAKANKSKEQSKTIWQQLPEYIIFTELGLVGGAAGVALAIGLAIAIQSLLSPVTIFLPGFVLLGVGAALIGAGISGLLGRMAHHIFPALSCNLDLTRLQLMLIVSTFTSLLQTFLFMLVL